MMYDDHAWARRKWAGMTAVDPATGSAYMTINELPLMFGFQPLFTGWRKATKPKIFLPSLQGRTVSYDSYRKKIKMWVEAIGLDKEDYSTHSLRRGGTSMLRMTGLSDAQI